MINLLIGPPGGGKSYEAVAFHVLPALAAGRKVITNLPLNLQHFSLINLDYLDLIDCRFETSAVRPVFDVVKAELSFKRFGTVQKQTYFINSAFAHVEDYGDPWRHPETGAGPLYVIDECHIPLPASGTSIPVEHWYSLHRHESADVLLMTQSYGKINKSIRDLVQICYRVKKNTALGSASSYIRKVQDGVRGEVVNTSIRKYEKKYFSFYQSHTKGGGSELAANDIIPMWRRWPVIGSALMFSVFFIMVLTGNFQNPMKPHIKTMLVVPVDVSSPDLITPASVIAKQNIIPVESESVDTEPVKTDPYSTNGLHIVGHVESKNKTLWIISISQNGQRLRNLYQADLEKVGYYFQPISDCAAWLSYKTEKRFLKCDAPSVNPTSGTSNTLS